MRTCLRCYNDETPSDIGAMLFNFICDYCRRDISDVNLEVIE
jgi:hypothetical protein